MRCSSTPDQIDPCPRVVRENKSSEGSVGGGGYTAQVERPTSGCNPEEGRWAGGRWICSICAVEQVVYFMNPKGTTGCSVILILNSNHDCFLKHGNEELLGKGTCF